MDYKVLHMGHHWEKQIYHVNLLKEWQEPGGHLALAEEKNNELGPQCHPKGEKIVVEERVRMDEGLTSLQKRKMISLAQAY